MKGFTLWFTGLSGAGKTTLSKLVVDKLRERDIEPEILDGDVVRTHLSKGLGFSREDRETNLKRIAFVCKLLTRNAACVVACTISPYQHIRQHARSEIGNYVQVHVNCPLEVCERRDPKGLYKKARSGLIENFTGITDPYEVPKNSEIEVNTAVEDPEMCAERIIRWLEKNDYVPRVVSLVKDGDK